MAWGRTLNGLRWPKAWPTPRKPWILAMILYKQTLGAKIQSWEGNIPNRMLRSLSNYLVEKEVIERWQTRRWAWKQPSFKESVIAHWSNFMASKMYRGSSDLPKWWDFESTHHMQLYSNCMLCSYSIIILSQWGVYLGKQSALIINGCLCKFFFFFFPSVSSGTFCKLKKVVDDNTCRYQKWKCWHE